MNRLFIGSFLSDDEREIVRTLMSSKMSLGLKWGKSFRFAALEKMHLTWMFLGDCDDQCQENIRSIIADTANKVQPCTIEYDRFAIWPNERFPRVGVLLASNPSAELVSSVEEMQSRIKPLLQNPGSEHGKYKAHITLFRFKAKCFSVAEFNTSEHLPLKQTINEVALIRSDLQNYEILEVFPLKGVIFRSL